jgi:hypothetical protein
MTGMTNLVSCISNDFIMIYVPSDDDSSSKMFQTHRTEHIARLGYVLDNYPFSVRKQYTTDIHYTIFCNFDLYHIDILH